MVNIKNAPINAPINAPTIGISAVSPTTAAVTPAYGKRSITIPTKQRHPRIAASVHCPTIKLEKVLFAILR